MTHMIRREGQVDAIDATPSCWTEDFMAESAMSIEIRDLIGITTLGTKNQALTIP